MSKSRGPLSKTDAEKKLRYCLEHGIVEPHPHFKKALKDDGVDLVDAYQVLKSGRIYSEPELDIKFGQWRYSVEGNEPEGNWLKIVVAFLEDDHTLLITAILTRK
jgi:hypothetical protein